MARVPGVVVPSFLHHGTQRGHRRQTAFFCVDDHLYYIELPGQFSKQAETDIRAWCLMPN